MDDGKRLAKMLPIRSGRIISKCLIPETAAQWARNMGESPDFFLALRITDNIQLLPEGSEQFRQFQECRTQRVWLRVDGSIDECVPMSESDWRNIEGRMRAAHPAVRT